MLQKTPQQNTQTIDENLLSACDKEPIHAPGTIQPHGFLIACRDEPSLEIVHVSNNTLEYVGLEAEELLGCSLNLILDLEQCELLKKMLIRNRLEGNPKFLFRCQFLKNDNDTYLNAMVHRVNGLIIVEFESTQGTVEINHDNIIFFLKSTLAKIRSTIEIDAFWKTIITELKFISGFDRVMVYEFDPDGHGSVIAEVKEAGLEPFLGLHYPATDIPQQARELYVLNGLRTIPDINYQPVQLIPLVNPVTNEALNLSYATLRSVSPVHVKYLQNMGVVGTLTLSIIVNNSLWGLIACHHYSPKYIPFEIRTVCAILGHFISLEYGVRIQKEEYLYRLELQSMKSRFIEFISHSESLLEGLVNFSPNLGDYIHATGAAIYICTKSASKSEPPEEELETVGLTPNPQELQALISWLQVNMEDVLYSTHELSRVYPPALHYKDVASGILAISISSEPDSFVIWFRPENIQTVHWAGDPNEGKPRAQSGEILTPRVSFALWKETVQLKALRWTSYEHLAALEVRDLILRIRLLKAEELKQKNEELEALVEAKTLALLQSNRELEKFATIASHDLQAPLRKVSQFSNFLLASASNELSTENFDYLERIQKSVGKMQLLIDDLLQLARISRKAQAYSSVDLKDIILLAIRDLEPNIQSCKGTIEIGESLVIDCDPLQIHQMFLNLIENAFKFKKQDVPPMVTITMLPVENNWCEIKVSDNGIGFDEKYLDRIFKIFERLHGVSTYEGTGIGLSIVQKVVDRHHGTIVANSTVGKGSTFTIRLPITQKSSIH